MCLMTPLRCCCYAVFASLCRRGRGTVNTFCPSTSLSATLVDLARKSSLAVTTASWTSGRHIVTADLDCALPCEVVTISREDIQALARNQGSQACPTVISSMSATNPLQHHQPVTGPANFKQLKLPQASQRRTIILICNAVAS